MHECQRQGMPADRRERNPTDFGSGSISPLANRREPRIDGLIELAHHGTWRARALCRNHIHGQHCRRVVTQGGIHSVPVAVARAAEKAGDLTV
jgi:hypothetical protein